MKTLAAVLVETGKPLVIEELEIPALRPGQVLVEVKYSGVCRNQLAECRGYRGKDVYLPHCLGHEGSGVVLEVGPSVTKVKAGDRVLLSWMKGLGADVPSTAYKSHRGTVNSGSITTFMQTTVVSENRVSILPDQVTFRESTIFGCAVPTGLGAVFNTAQARAGQSAVVFGVGGVGLCAVAGASIAGCSPVVAVDINPKKLEVARGLGATHCVEVNGGDLVAELREIIGGGFDVAIEASGQPQAMVQALAAVKDRGGVAVVLGNATFGTKLSIEPRELNHGKQLRGSWGGDNKPDQDFPRYFNLLHGGKLKLDSLISRSYSLEQINDAINDLEAGEVIRPVIEMGGNN
jgi:S-(hydroxymethyl)glutathione dehydrogenase / alcohol dehydrogenase